MLKSFVSKNREDLISIGLFVFRVGACVLMLTYHGFRKVETLFVGNEIEFVNPIGIGVTLSFVLAAFAEFICSIFILFGLWTRLASLILVINMAVATVVLASGGGNPELPIFYLLSFFLLFCTGAGKHSMDYRIQKKFR